MENYQWFPGHMTKAFRMMRESISGVDMVLELRDARAALCSGNPDVEALIGDKKRLMVLNKADLADERENRLFTERFKEEGIMSLAVCGKNKGDGARIKEAMRSLMQERIKKNRSRGVAAGFRVMVAGIPNVGKSTVINNLAGRALTKTANRPGVTRGKQWITIDDGIHLLDTPGVLWPKFEDAETGRRLAMIGSMNDVNLDMETLAVSFVKLMREYYPGTLSRFYGYTDEEADAVMEEEHLFDRDAAEIAMVAKKRGCVKKGGFPDYEKAAVILMTDFRNGKTGRISLDRSKA